MIANAALMNIILNSSLKYISFVLFEQVLLVGLHESTVQG